MREKLEEDDRAGPTDEQIVGRVIAGEEDFFESLVRRYQSRIVSHMARMVGSREEAADLAGDAAIDQLRKRRLKTRPLEVSDSDGKVSSPEYKGSDLDPYAMLRNSERGDAIATAIASLAPEFRELITLRHFTGLSYEEIAEVKGMPLGTVKNKLFRARVGGLNWWTQQTG